MEWYSLIDEESLISQGDIIFDCPIIFLNKDFDLNNLDKPSEEKLMVATTDVIVMTQSCDLANNPPDFVIVARIIDIGEITSWSTLSEINSGRRPAYHLIKSYNDDSINMNYKVVDFSQIYSVPLRLLTSRYESQDVRLRLRSPYLEFMSQRFGNYFSRVGLPQGIDKDELKSAHQEDKQ